MNGEIHAQRRAALARAMASKGVAQVLLNDMRHVFYFTGFSILFPGVKNRAALAVDRQGHTTLLVSAPLAEGAAGHADAVVPVAHPYVPGPAERDALFDRALAEVTGQSAGALAATEGVLRPDIAGMRRRKDALEQEQLRRLAHLAGVGYQAVREACLSGNTELDMLLAAKAACVRANALDIFVSGDFVSGERTLEIGGEATARILNPGENVIVDLWLIGGHYWSDTCRTFFVDGDASAERAGIVEMLRGTKASAEAMVRPGVRAVDVHAHIQEALASAGHHCPHHLGHGIGLDFWEPPFITADSTDQFQPGDAFTIEIGVYHEANHAARIEDNYLVTETGVTRITGAD